MDNRTFNTRKGVFTIIRTDARYLPQNDSYRLDVKVSPALVDGADTISIEVSNGVIDQVLRQPELLRWQLIAAIEKY